MEKKDLKVPRKIKAIMKMVHGLIEIDNFILFGGNVIDYFISKKSNLQDIDIIIPDKKEKTIRVILKRLTKKGFSVSEKRTYVLLKKKKVILVQADKNNIGLDIAFSESLLEVIGPYNALAMYCPYGSKKCFDDHGCIDSIVSKKFSLLNRSFKEENPFILISRFLLLCTKYNASLLTPESHKNIIKEFNSYKTKQSKKSKFEREVYLSFISKVFKSILISINKSKYIKELIKSRILEDSFPELQLSLKVIIGNKKQTSRLKKIKEKEELINFFGKQLNNKNRDSYYSLLSGISHRKWDKEDSKFSIKNKNLELLKTSNLN
jgi:hypothetical protein